MLEDNILDEDELNIQAHGRKAMHLYKVNLIITLVAIACSLLMMLFGMFEFLAVIVLCMMAAIPISILGFVNIIQSNKKEEHFPKIKKATYGHTLISLALVLAISFLTLSVLNLL